jgi:hypothetical protein
MKKIFNTEYCASLAKTMARSRVFILKGTAFTMDAHSIRYSLSTPFFPRR